MSFKFSIGQKVKMVMLYSKFDSDLKKTQAEFLRLYPFIKDVPIKIIRFTVRKFESTGSVIDVPPIQREKHRSQKIQEVQKVLEYYPDITMRDLGLELGRLVLILLCMVNG